MGRDRCLRVLFALPRKHAAQSLGRCLPRARRTVPRHIHHRGLRRGSDGSASPPNPASPEPGSPRAPKSPGSLVRPEAYQQSTNIQSPDRPPLSTRPLTWRARARRVLYTTLHLTSLHFLHLPGDTAALLSQVNASAEALCALCEHHGFDGYLINLETPFTVSKYK